MKYAKMPEEALVMNEYDYSSDVSSAGESEPDDDGDDSEEEREKRLKELQEQVGNKCSKATIYSAYSS